ncbi:MAG: Rpn family recombination-promoting nuclease/putative transposase [bacterium]|nr:Rpn family recombination-promoting nuclease/putative transposase [bacterium]
MGAKDLTAKKLEDYNDVFADIYNTLLFDKELIKEQQLDFGPTESIYKAADDGNAEQRRDTLKNYRNEMRFIIAAFGMENQSTLDDTMPIRIMGYDFGSYHQQLTQKKRNTKQLYPVITIVLNFSDKRWHDKKSLHDILTIPKEFKEYVQDYKICVFDIAFLDDETIGKFQSDFKHIARFFKDKRLKKSSWSEDRTSVKYPAEIAEFLTVFTGDRRYIDTTEYIVQRKEKGENVTMCTIAQALEDRGIQKGMQKGIGAMYSLVHEHIITPEIAAQKLDVSVEELESMFKEYGYTD